MKFLFGIALFLRLLIYNICNGDVDASKTLVWGPGLHPDNTVLPVQYFFIHAVDENNNKFFESPGDVFVVSIKDDENRQNIWIQKLDKKDGSFIVRYKVYKEFHNAKLIILYKDKHVASSPYKISAFPDDCDCPEAPLSEWLEMMHCPKKYAQIEADLKIFRTVKFSKLYPIIMQRFNYPESMSICNYIIKNNKIYRRCFGKHVDFKMFVDAILLSLTRKTVLPDIEFFMNLGDWPLSPLAGRPAIPLFSWCGSDDTLDIHVPTYDLTGSTLQCMDRVLLDIMSAQTSMDLSWKDRIPKAFWRGRDSRRERLNLVTLSRQHPDLLNASLTFFFFHKKEEEEFGPKVDHISFFKFFDYKYQVNVDGTVAAYRLPYLLAGGSLVLKQESKYHEHFYSQLEPWVHYVPIRPDLSDLVTHIRWAQNNDEKAHEIAVAGQKFVQENLLPKDIFCYHGRLLEAWSKRLVDNVEIREEMELVLQPKAKHNCSCDQRSSSTFHGDRAKDEL